MASRSSLLPLRESAMLVGGTATKNERAAELMKVIREEIAKLAEEGPSEHEVEEAKRYIIGSYPLRFDTSPKIASELLGLAINGFEPEFLAERNRLFAAVTLADVKRVARAPVRRSAPAGAGGGTAGRSGLSSA